MAVNQRAPASRQFHRRLGLPDLSGQYPLAGAMFVDSLGDGLFVPFAVVYFLRTTALPLPLVGLGLSVASLLALPSAPVSGIMIDRLSSTAVVIAGNLTSAVAFAGYLFVRNLWELVLFAFLAAAGNRAFWTGNLALVGDAFPGQQRARWFAFQRAARNAGYGLGGLLAAAALGSGSGIGYRTLAIANTVSYLLAAVGVYRWSRRYRLARKPKPAGKPGSLAGGGFRVVLTDRPFLLLAALNVMFVLCLVSIDVLLALYLVRGLHKPVWLSGFGFAFNTIAVAALQTAVWGLFAHRRPRRVLQISAGVWGVSFLLLWALAALPGALAIPGLFVAMAVFTAAELIQGPVLNGLVVAAAPEACRGRYLAVYQLSWALGQAVAPGVLSWLYSASPAWPWIALTVGCGVCVLTLATRAGTAIGTL